MEVPLGLDRQISASPAKDEHVGARLLPSPRLGKGSRDVVFREPVAKSIEEMIAAFVLDERVNNLPPRSDVPISLPRHGVGAPEFPA
jgi:hypothetical protein